MAIKIDGDITIKDGNTDLKKLKELVPVELWSGTNSSGSIELSDSSANYSFIEVYYQNRQGHESYTKVYNPNGKTISLRTGNSESMDGYDVYSVCHLSFSGKDVTRGKERVVNLHNNAYPSISNSSSSLSYYTLTITKIIGYK